jgi:Translation initiation factor 1 (IF-1)
MRFSLVKQKNRDNGSKGEMPLPSDEEGTMICVVQKVIGAGFLEVICSDGNKYKAWIPGKMRRRVWLHERDTILFLPWGTSDMKGEVVHKYQQSEVKELMQKGLLPKDLLGEEGG